MPDGGHRRGLSGADGTLVDFLYLRTAGDPEGGGASRADIAAGRAPLRPWRALHRFYRDGHRAGRGRRIRICCCAPC